MIIMLIIIVVKNTIKCLMKNKGLIQILKSITIIIIMKIKYMGKAY